jgi:hypothetical protein
VLNARLIGGVPYGSCKSNFFHMKRKKNDRLYRLLVMHQIGTVPTLQVCQRGKIIYFVDASWIVHLELFRC